MNSVEEVLGRPWPSYHRPLAIAGEWLRSGQRRGDAIRLLKWLRQQYAHVLAVGNELVLALLEDGRYAEALAELDRLKGQFRKVDEETHSRWGRVYKQEGDRAWKEGDLVTAERRYREALEQYAEGYRMRQGHYPGINQATVWLLLAAVVRERGDTEGSLTYQRQSERIADDVLARRPHWTHDLPDDNIWHVATAGEAHLLKHDWARAAREYGLALRESNVQPFHRQTIGRQARRIIDAWARLDVRPEPPFDDVDRLFAVGSGQ
jgi:tetratricopeptide (TPR) repeat protein